MNKKDASKIHSRMGILTVRIEMMQHDFFNDPLKLTIDGEWMQAIGTTLGADNGIGVAAGSIGFCNWVGISTLKTYHLVFGSLAILQ